MRIFKNRKAATAIEYCLLAAIFALVVLTAFYFFSDQIGIMYNRVKDAVVSANESK